MPGMSEEDLATLIRRYAKDPKDKDDFRARVHMDVGDEEFWHCQYEKAAQAYWLALKLRPWWMRAWAKYLLLRTGSIGVFLRQWIVSLRESRVQAR
jgi:hypothetical protein